MTTIRTLLATAFVALACAGTASAAAPSYLFSGFASTATATGSTITVPNSTKLTWFTDRPARHAGGTTVGRLAATWAANGFADAPPNAVITIGSGDARASYVVTLSRPRTVGSATRFAYRLLPKGSMLGMRTDGAIAGGTHRSVGLFIDGGAGCWDSALGLGTDCEMFTFTAYTISGTTGNVRLCDANDAWHQYDTTVTRNGTVIYAGPPRACPDGGFSFAVTPSDSVSIHNGDMTTHIWITS